MDRCDGPLRVRTFFIFYLNLTIICYCPEIPLLNPQVLSDVTRVPWFAELHLLFTHLCTKSRMGQDKTGGHHPSRHPHLAVCVAEAIINESWRLNSSLDVGGGAPSGERRPGEQLQTPRERRHHEEEKAGLHANISESYINLLWISVPRLQGVFKGEITRRKFKQLHLDQRL